MAFATEVSQSNTPPLVSKTLPWIYTVKEIDQVRT